MILRRVKLEQFRKHNLPIEFRLNERMTIVYGPNEAGKSTIFQALQYAFFRRSGSSGADIARLAPWDTHGLKPTVIVDFADAGTEYRLEKSFGARGGTMLSKLDAAGKATPFTSDGADDFVTALFCGEPPGKGGFSGFQARHLGLAQLLFAPQGRIPILKEDKDLALNSNARARLSQAIGTAGQTEREAQIAQRIEKAYDAWFKSGGQLRKTAASLALAEEIRLLDAEIECNAVGVSNLESLAFALNQAQESSAVRAVAAAQAQERVKAERPRFVEAVELKGALNAAQASFDRAVSAYTTAVERKRAIGATRELLAVEEEKERKLAAALAACEASLLEATGACDAARATWNEATSEDGELAATRRQLAEANLTELMRGEREKLALRQHDIASLDAQLAAKNAELSALPEVDAATIATLERLAKRGQELATQLAAARTRVTFTPERTITVRWTAAGIERPESAAAGEPAEFTGDGPIRLAIEGVGSIEIRGPVADLAAAHLELANVRDGIGSIEAAAGTSDIGTLRVARARSDVLREEIAAVQASRSARLGGSDHAALSARIAAIDAKLAGAAATSEREALSERIAERERSNAIKRNEASATCTKYELALTVARGGRDGALAACTEIKAQKLAPLRAELARLLANQSDDDREVELGAAFGQSETAKQALNRARFAYAPFADLADPAALLRAADDQAQTYGQLAQAAEGECIALRAKLEAQRKTEPSAGLSEFQEKRERVLRKLERARTDERAIERLHELVKSAEEQRIAGYAAPVLARVGPWFERVFGHSLSTLEIDENHAMESLHVGGVEHAIAVGELSVGALDQLGLLIRLGYASLLTAPDRLGRMPILLDDPLVHADELRRRRLLAIINELTEQAQVIIFTCRPEDYAGANAPMLSMTAASLDAPVAS
jgi:energy-coupling factor transporter ATP-binding protein EcfA2